MLASWKESYDKPRQHIKSRDITLPTKVHIVKAMVFPVVKYGCENWTIKKAEHWRTDAFELWCWRRLLRVPWTVRRSDQSILKEINPEYSLERLMLKLKLQYFSHLMWRADSLEKTLMLGKIEGRRRRGWQRIRWLDSITDSMDMNLSKLREMVKDREAWHATIHGIAESDTIYQLNNVWHSCLQRTGWPFIEFIGSLQRSSITSLQLFVLSSLCCWSFAKLCLMLCDPMDCSTPFFPVLHQLLELVQTHVHWVGDAIQPSHPLSSPFPAFSLP